MTGTMMMSLKGRSAVALGIVDGIGVSYDGLGRLGPGERVVHTRRGGCAITYDRLGRLDAPTIIPDGGLALTYDRPGRLGPVSRSSCATIGWDSCHLPLFDVAFPYAQAPV